MNLLDNNKALNLIEQVPINLLYKDLKGRYVLASNVCSYLENIDLIGKTDEDILPNKELGKKLLQDDLRVMANKKPSKCIEKIESNDRIYYCEIRRNPLFDDSGQVIGMLESLIDVTELVKLREFYYEKSIIDNLTGIYNRTYLEDKYMNFEYEKNNEYGVIICDCNNLKLINDKYGHSSGDELIKLVANTLKEKVESYGEVIRIGGDEFLIIISKADENTFKNLIQDMRRELNQKKINGIQVDASFGYAIKSQELKSMNNVINRADEMMYIDKRRSKQDKQK